MSKAEPDFTKAERAKLDRLDAKRQKLESGEGKVSPKLEAIVPATVENSAAYIGGWIKTLKGDKRLAVVAAGAAQRAADWIRNVRSQEQANGQGGAA